MAGPANCAAACPVMTKMPAPMTAPTPRVSRLIGPRARRRQFSPVSSDSFISVSTDMVANSFMLYLEDCGELRAPTRLGSTAAHDSRKCQRWITSWDEWFDRRLVLLPSGHLLKQ